MSSENLEVLTRKLNLPLFSSFNSINSLILNLVEESKIDPDDEDLEEKYLSQGILNQTGDIYLYSTAALLSEAFFRTKWLYRKNNIPFDETSIISDVEINRIQPPELEKRIMQTSIDLISEQDFLKYSAEQILQGIETRIAVLTKHYSTKYQSKELNEFLLINSRKILDYVKVAEQLSKIFIGFKLFTEAGQLNIFKDIFPNSNIILNDLKTDNIYDKLNSVIKIHSAFRGVKYGDDVSPFIGLTGEEIALSMELANMFDEAYHLSSDLVSSKKEKLIVPRASFMYLADNGESIRDLWKQEPSVCIGEQIRNDKRLETMLSVCKAPFFDLEQRLHVFGIPYQLAKNVVEYLVFTETDRVHYSDQVKSKKEMLQQLKKQGPKYSSAVRKLVDIVTHGKTSLTAYQYYSFMDNLNQAPGISTALYITRIKDGKVEIVDERDFPYDEKTTLNMVKHNAFQVLARKNIGCCFLLNNNPLGEMFNPNYCYIDSRECTDGIVDSLSVDLVRLQVDVHESVHARQTGSRIIWRSIASAVTNYVCDKIIQHDKQGTLDIEMPFLHFEAVSKKRNTIRQMYLEVLDFYTKPALATGDIGEKIRSEGLLSTMYEMGQDPIKDGKTDPSIYRKLELEDSQTSSLVRRLKDAINKRDIERIKKLEIESEELYQQQLSIIEHTAEAYSLLGIQEYLNHFPDKRYSKATLDDYYNRVKNKVLRRGVMAQQFQSVISQTSNEEEMIKRLRNFGLKYVSETTSNVSAKENLVELGYDQIDTFSAYDNMTELFRRAREHNFKINDVLLPYNGAVALIGLRYGTEIPLFMDLARKLGENSFETICNLETLDQVRQLNL
jgi:hypothetical protein